MGNASRTGSATTQLINVSRWLFLDVLFLEAQRAMSNAANRVRVNTAIRRVAVE
jgi:hypothetical protein